MGEPTIEISGPEAEDAGRELQALLREAFGEEGRRRATAPTQAPGQKIEPATLDLIMIAMTIPGTLLATIDLTGRMKLVEKAKRLIAWAEGRRKTGTRIAVVSPKGTSVDLARAEPADVVAALTEENRDAEAQTKK
jgi:hypothetical protein